jgi:hypothetical protein
MSDHETQTTAAGDSIAPAADAIEKCSPLFDPQQRDGMSVGVGEASQTGDIPTVVSNDRACTRATSAAISVHYSFARPTSIGRTTTCGTCCM